MLGTLYARDYRRSTYNESQKPSTKKSRAKEHYKDDDNSESIPRFNHKKYKPYPEKGKQQKTAGHCGTQNDCVICKKEG